MDISLGEDYSIYEHKELECLVAIMKDDQKLIKAYWKKNKGKTQKGFDLVPGYRLTHDDSQDSLKIVFNERLEFEIKSLIKFE